MTDGLEPLGLPEPEAAQMLSTIREFVVQHPLETLGASLVIGAGAAGLMLASRRRTATDAPGGAGWTPLVVGALGAVAAALAAAGAKAASAADTTESATPGVAEASDATGAVEPAAGDSPESPLVSPDVSPSAAPGPVGTVKPAEPAGMDWATATGVIKEDH